MSDLVQIKVESDEEDAKILMEAPEKSAGDQVAASPHEDIPNTPQMEGIDTDETEKKSTKRKKFQSKLKTDKMTLRQIGAVEEEIRKVFSDLSDPIYATLQSVKAQRSKKKRRTLETVLEGASPRNVKDWADFVSKCQKELTPDDEILVKALAKLEERKTTHRVPIEKELHGEEELTLKRLIQIERRAVGELGSHDPLVEEAKEMQTQREKSHKEPLVARYTKLMKGKLKDVSVNILNEFVKECEVELDPEDPLLAQARSACEARVLNKTDSSKAKQVRKKKESNSKEKSSKNKDKVGSDDSVIVRVPDVSAASSKASGKDKGGVTVSGVVSSVAHEFSGVEDSVSYKVTFMLTFVLFSYILLSYLQLVVKIVPLSISESKTAAPADPNGAADAGAAAGAEG